MSLISGCMFAVVCFVFVLALLVSSIFIASSSTTVAANGLLDPGVELACTLRLLRSFEFSDSRGVCCCGRGLVLFVLPGSLRMPPVLTGGRRLNEVVGLVVFSFLGLESMLGRLMCFRCCFRLPC